VVGAAEPWEGKSDSLLTQACRQKRLDDSRIAVRRGVSNSLTQFELTFRFAEYMRASLASSARHSPSRRCRSVSRISTLRRYRALANTVDSAGKHFAKFLLVATVHICSAAAPGVLDRKYHSIAAQRASRRSWHQQTGTGVSARAFDFATRRLAGAAISRNRRRQEGNYARAPAVGPCSMCNSTKRFVSSHSVTSLVRDRLENQPGGELRRVCSLHCPSASSHCLAKRVPDNNLLPRHSDAKPRRLFGSKKPSNSIECRDEIRSAAKERNASKPPNTPTTPSYFPAFGIASICEPGTDHWRVRSEPLQRAKVFPTASSRTVSPASAQRAFYPGTSFEICRSENDSSYRGAFSVKRMKRAYRFQKESDLDR